MKPQSSFLSSAPSMSVRARRAVFESGGSNGQSSDIFHGGKTPHVPLGSPRRSSRKPLGFLSPNFKKRGGKTTLDTDVDNVAQLKHEISNLQHRIKGLHTPDNVVGDRCNELTPNNGVDDTSQGRTQREEHLVELNKKLVCIQTGLAEIEGERYQLVTKAKQLELEKVSLTEQLGNREKEIEALQKRCVLAADQSKESYFVRSTNQKLSRLVVRLQSELETRENELVQVTELKLKLHESQTLRDELKQRLHTVQRNHDSVCESMVKCLATVESLTNEKIEWEAEKRRLLQHIELQLEQQRLEHIQATIELRQDLRSREKKVNDLDRLLQDKVESIQRLRNQLSDLESSQAETLKQVATEYDRKINEMQRELNQKVASEVERQLRDVNHSHEKEVGLVHNEISDLHTKLCEKSAEIEALRNDVSVHMQELMTATSELQKLQEDSKLLDSLFQDVETLEQERYDLSETLHERDTEIAELSAEILKLELEKELAEQDTLKVRALEVKLEAKVQECESTESRLHQVTEACQYLEDQIRCINADNDEAVARIKAEYDEAICGMQVKLQSAEAASQSDKLIHQEVLTAKDKTIASMGDQMAAIVSDYQGELTSLREDMQKAMSELSLKENELRNFKDIKLSEKETLISSLREVISQMTAESQTSKDKATTEIHRLEGLVEIWRSKSADLEDAANEQASKSQKEIVAVTETNSDLLKENDALRNAIFEQSRRLEDFEQTGKRSGVEADTKISQLEEQIRQLKATTLDMENLLAVCSREHVLEVESMARTIAEFESLIEAAKFEQENQEEMLHQAKLQMKEQQAAFDMELARLEQQILQQATQKSEDLQNKLTLSSRDHITIVLQLKQTVTDLQKDVEFLQATNADQQKMLELATCGTSTEVVNLKEQINELKSRSHDTEATNAEKARDFQATIDKMKHTISDMKRERDFSSIALMGCERKLDEEISLRLSLAKKFEALAESESSLQKECRLLRMSAEEAQNERNTLALAMERDMNHREFEQEESLRNELASAEQKLVTHEQQMAVLEEALQDRTKLLADMVTQSKELQARIDQSDVEYKEMEEQSSVLQVRLLDKDEELKRLRSEWQKTEDQYLGEIHIERNLRELYEADLAAARTRLETAKVESRDLSELEKENQSLKDKIRRQEAYLQRKIEQEKAVRERILPGSAIKHPTSALKTPARSTSISSTNKGGTVRKVASALASQATRSTVLESELVDLDLDSLLAD